MIELEGTEEIGPRMRLATHLQWPDNMSSRRTNIRRKGNKICFSPSPIVTSGSSTRRRT